MKAKEIKWTDGTLWGYSIKCVGCNETHDIPTTPRSGRPGAQWTFNGDLDKPTFNPSLLLRTGIYADPAYVPDPEMEAAGYGSKICHSFIRDGNIQYLDDCTHGYKGLTVALPELTEKDDV